MSEHHDERLDLRVEEELRRMTATPALGQMSRTRLRNRILASAESVLRPVPSWWEVAGRWAGPLVPAAAAALLLVAVLLPDVGDRARDLAVETIDPVETMAEWSWLDSGETADEPLSDPEAFLLAVFSDER